MPCLYHIGVYLKCIRLYFLKIYSSEEIKVWASDWPNSDLRVVGKVYFSRIKADYFYNVCGLI